MRYARPSCEECIRLAAESAELWREYLEAKDALALTSKNDRLYGERRKQLKSVVGRVREARKRDDSHEDTHQDEFH